MLPKLIFNQAKVWSKLATSLKLMFCLAQLDSIKATASQRAVWEVQAVLCNKLAAPYQIFTLWSEDKLPMEQWYWPKLSLFSRLRSLDVAWHRLLQRTVDTQQDERLDWLSDPAPRQQPLIRFSCVSQERCLATAGKAKYDAKKHAIVWKIKRFNGMMEHTLSGNVDRLSTTKDKKAWSKPPISMAFQVPHLLSCFISMSHSTTCNCQVLCTSQKDSMYCCSMPSTIVSVCCSAPMA